MSYERNEMNIDEMTIEQLKALAFDQVTERDRITNNLNIIVAKIAELEKDAELQKQNKKPPKS